MNIGPFEKYFGCSLEGGARCACHARQERTDINVLPKSTQNVLRKLLVCSFCDVLRKLLVYRVSAIFKGNEIHFRCILQIRLLLFFLLFFFLGFAFLYIFMFFFK